MDMLSVFSDTPLEAEAARVLVQGVAPHRVIVPSRRLSSILGEPEPDAAFLEAEIAFGQPDLASVARSERLRWIQISTAGFTRYDTAEFRELVQERGIVVTNSSSVYAAACAEHVLAFMLAEARRLPQALASRAANGSEEWLRLRGESRPLEGCKVMLLGYGGIASRLVKLLAPFGMDLVAVRRSPRGDEGLRVVRPEEVKGELADADHVINILPDNEESRKWVDSGVFGAMKEGVVFYNIGRGTTVDQEALLEALRSGRVGSAWLDVTEPEPLAADHPLRGEPNCFITPHTAGGHGDEGLTLVKHFLGNFRRFLAGEEMKDRVM